MKRLLFLLLLILVAFVGRADNFVIRQGQSVKFFQPEAGSDDCLKRADRLFTADYEAVLGGRLEHTARIADARIIAATYTNAELRRYARLRGISFERLAGHPDEFILKVNNNGQQLFVVGGSDRATAFGLMTLSRRWGVSPFCQWFDAPALPLERFELDVVFEQRIEPAVPVRKLVMADAEADPSRVQDLLLRLRATDCSCESPQTMDWHEQAFRDAASAREGVFAWTLMPAACPYDGLNLALEHPERLRIEGIRAFDHGCKSEWQVRWVPQLGGELQLVEFFDMAWDVAEFRNAYAVDRLTDQHYAQVSGISTTWSQLWNDYFDLSMLYPLDRPLSLETLRRGIGESQSLALQLSLELNEKTVTQPYNEAFFRAVEYPVNMLTSQIQRLCHEQLLAQGVGTRWTLEDCLHRMQVLGRELNERMAPRWPALWGAAAMPGTDVGQSAVRVEGEAPSEASTALLYRSDRAYGAQVKPFEPLHLPLNYQAGTLRLQVALLPTRSFGKNALCSVTVDNGEPQYLQVEQHALAAGRQLFDLTFSVDPALASHQISFRTTSDGIYVQRVWLCDVK